MTFLLLLGIVVLVAGCVLAAYGGYVVATGRMGEKARGAYRSAREAGLYTLFSGLALACLAAGQLANNADDVPKVFPVVAITAALVLFGVAFLRYRPREPNKRR